jgi:hypothetical protein
MDVIQHDAPGKQPVSLSVEKEQGIFDNRGDLWNQQEALTQASIERRIHPRAFPRGGRVDGKVPRNGER